MTLDGTAYIGVVGSETGNATCWASIMNIQRQPGDGEPLFIFATKGYESRQAHINRFLASDHDWLLLLDGDMTFPEDTLERLRAHNEPFVSGYYLRRSYSRPLPVWFQYPDDPGAFDLSFWTETPERGRLHKLGASGWGCVLVHREVVTAVRDLLCGEWEVLEDDMDVWPFDVAEVVGTLKTARDTVQYAIDINDAESLAVNGAVEMLDDLIGMIRPLRMKKDPVGSDLRFPFFARQAGYDLWGDPDVRCGHMIEYPLEPSDWEGLTEERRAQVAVAAGQKS